MGSADRLDKAAISLAIAIAFVAGLGTAALADSFTGGDLLEQDKQFGTGYVFGVLEADLGIYNEAYTTTQDATRKCLIAGGMNSDILYGAVIRYIRANPSALVAPAFGAVLRAVGEICPTP